MFSERDRRAVADKLLVGAESGDQEALDLIGKGITVEDTIAFLERCKQWSIPLDRLVRRPQRHRGYR